MKLIDDIRNEVAKQPERGNKVKRFMDSLEAEEVAELLKIFRDDEITTSAIQRAFRKNGFVVSHAQLSRYRESVRGDI